MYNLLEYSLNYSETTKSLWFYFKSEATNFSNDIKSTDGFHSFKYKNKLLENTVAQLAPNQPNGIIKITTIAVLFKLFNLYLEITRNYIN